ncbi:uncharacterized protein LOC108625508 [Ceratina calcarata]|uniref:Uncharacterized protein LOC108625508 n=1 Tax=Ceratina calcarata TaxID=156304 RepID=A0AAJ7J0F7_9HYME|nr:uncharacterized protein LOC108625508 [Ceratina calcarata]
MPRITFGALIWWQGTKPDKIKSKLESLQHTALKRVLSAFRYSPTKALEAILATLPIAYRIEEAAIRTAKLLHDGGRWSPIDQGHSTINLIKETVPNNEPHLLMLMEAPSDRITPTYHLSNKCKTHIPSRSEWKSKTCTPYSKWITWYTDGSKDEEGNTGCAWLTGLPLRGSNEYLGNTTTVYQAEIMALIRCTEYMIHKDIKEVKIVIFTDSQAAIKALSKPMITSTLTLKCNELLNKLATKNRYLTICWSPGHVGIPGSEKADRIAKEAMKKVKPEQEPWVPISFTTFKMEIKKVHPEQIKAAMEGVRVDKQKK